MTNFQIGDHVRTLVPPRMGQGLNHYTPQGATKFSIPAGDHGVIIDLYSDKALAVHFDADPLKFPARSIVACYNEEIELVRPLYLSAKDAEDLLDDLQARLENAEEDGDDDDMKLEIARLRGLVASITALFKEP